MASTLRCRGGHLLFIARCASGQYKSCMYPVCSTSFLSPPPFLSYVCVFVLHPVFAGYACQYLPDGWGLLHNNCGHHICFFKTSKYLAIQCSKKFDTLFNNKPNSSKKFPVSICPHYPTVKSEDEDCSIIMGSPHPFFLNKEYLKRYRYNLYLFQS